MTIYKLRWKNTETGETGICMQQAYGWGYADRYWTHRDKADAAAKKYTAASNGTHGYEVDEVKV